MNFGDLFELRTLKLLILMGNQILVLDHHYVHSFYAGIELEGLPSVLDETLKIHRQIQS